MLLKTNEYEKKVWEFIVMLTDTINSKIQRGETKLSFPSGQDNQLNNDFKNEAFTMFNLIIDSFRKGCENTESAFKQFYNSLPTTAKHPKYVAGALITYLLNWKNIRKINFGVMYRQEVIRLFESFSMGGLDKAFSIFLNLVKKLDDYGAIFIPSSKNITPLDLDFLVKRHLTLYCSEVLKANLTSMTYNALLRKSLNVYDQLLNKLSFNNVEQAVKHLFSEISPIKEPSYLSGSLIFYLLAKEEPMNLRTSFNKSYFSKIIRLKRKAFSDSFNIVQNRLNQIPNYEKIIVENRAKLNYLEFLELMNQHLVSSAIKLSVGNDFVKISLAMFDNILSDLGKGDKKVGFKLFYKAFKQQEIGYRHIFSAFLFIVFSIRAFERGSKLPIQNEFAIKLKISYPKFNVGVNFLRSFLKRVPNYEVILNLTPSESLSEKEYFRVVTNYIESYCQFFKDQKNLAKSTIKLYKMTLSNGKFNDFYNKLPSGSRQPKLIASVFLCIYLNYFKGIVLPQKEFVKTINLNQRYKTRYHGFNDLYSYVSEAYFKVEKEEYKKKLITDRKFHHKGKIYHFKVNLSKIESVNPEIKKGLTHLIAEILKGSIPRSFFKEMKGYRASDLVLKGDKKTQLIAIKRGKLGNDINIKEHLVEKIKDKVEHDESYELCVIAKEIIDEYGKKKINPPDNSFHEPILTKILEVNGDSIAIETPIWKEIKEDSSYFTGHIDLIMVKGDSLIICDYKKDIYEIYKSIPQIAAYGIMIKERIKSSCDLNEIKVKCLSFSSQTAIEFDPEIIKTEIKEFICLWEKKKNKPMVIKGSSRNLIDYIEKLICVGI